MNLTKAEAVRLFHEQWSYMQKELGECPTSTEREAFKRIWCYEHFPEETIENDCFLCEYTRPFDHMCNHCPIMWPRNNCCSAVTYGAAYYSCAPISEILALPVRKILTLPIREEV